ncbi:ribonuclease HII [Coraliomargarita parva]|uniref:ribonuclease HII n=1 Tax=Coraliomargarita parva TaxID=3014050 RepID=UPI0022B3A4A4|nr:ribonuclease HII [Coraliomargarita parva]
MNALQQHDRALLAECDWLVGIDEAGRGALAGPVVAGACVLGPGFFEDPSVLERSARINDSKQLSAAARESQYDLLLQLREEGRLDFEVASGSVGEIATHNILGATRLAMRRAVEALAARARAWSLPEAAAAGPLFEGCTGVKLIVDGRPLKPFPYVHQGIVKGDGRSISIAMASIAAKVLRDREMCLLDRKFPAYGFVQHKGYGTTSHRRALLAEGPSTVHREAFLRKILS